MVDAGNMETPKTQKKKWILFLVFVLLLSRFDGICESETAAAGARIPSRWEGGRIGMWEGDPPKIGGC